MEPEPPPFPSQQCDYCRAENPADSIHCSGCGTKLIRPATLQESSIPPLITQPEPRLRASTATLVFLAYFFGQFAVGMVAGVAAAVIAGFSGTNFERAIEASMPITVIGCFLVSSVAMFTAALFIVPDELTNTTPTGAAWKLGKRRHNLFAFALGVALGLLYLEMAILIGLEPDTDSLGPLAKMSTTKGFPQVVWVISAIVLAPPTEELLFRGVVYGGFRQSVGPLWAAIIVTFVFVLLHVTEMIYYWPSVLGITSLAVTALWMRLRSRAIGPAIAVHFGYNLTMAFIALTSDVI